MAEQFTPDTLVRIGNLTLKNPVLTASGTFGYGEEFTDFMDLGSIGGFIVKGTTLNHREGNPYPRMVWDCRTKVWIILLKTYIPA